MARPSKYTPIRTEAILTALRAGNTRTNSAAYAGVDYDTMLRWMARYAEFRGAVEKAEADAEAAAVGQVRKAMQDGVWTAGAWWLERRRPHDWGRVDRVEVTIRETAARIAAKIGADPDDLLRRAERIAAEASAP